MLPYRQLDPEEYDSFNLIQNSKVLIQGNALENVVCEMTANFASASVC